MWPFPSAKSAFQKAKQRQESRLQLLRQAARDGDVKAVCNMLFELYRYRGPAEQKSEPPAPPYWVMQSAVTTVAEKNRHAALQAGMYGLHMIQNADAAGRFCEKLLEIARNLDKRNANEMATAAMAACIVAQRAEDGSELQNRALEQWRATVGTLAPLNIKLAFAAASNAALSHATPGHPVNRAGIETWTQMVEALALEDKLDAKIEATRVFDNYANFGARAQPFHWAAFEQLEKLRGPRP